MAQKQSKLTKKTKKVKTLLHKEKVTTCKKAKER